MSPTRTPKKGVFSGKTRWILRIFFVATVAVLTWQFNKKEWEPDWPFWSFWAPTAVVVALLAWLGWMLIKKEDWRKEGKKHWKLALGLAVAMLLIFLGIRLWNWHEETEAENTRIAFFQAAEAEKAHKAYCAKSVWAEGCTPNDTVFTRLVRSSSPEVVPIPPYYRLDWWGACDKFVTSASMSGIMELQRFTTKPGVDTVTLNFHLYKPSEPHKVPATEC